MRTGLVQNAAVAHVQPEDGRDPFLVAYVVVNSALEGAAPSERSEAQESQVVEAWTKVNDDTYSSQNK